MMAPRLCPHALRSHALTLRGRARDALLVDELDQADDVVERGAGEEAVAEVEDVAEPPARAAQDVGRLLLHDLGGAEEGGGVEVALDAEVVADPLPGDVEWDAPVDANDRGAVVLQDRKS